MPSFVFPSKFNIHESSRYFAAVTREKPNGGHGFVLVGIFLSCALGGTHDEMSWKFLKKKNKTKKSLWDIHRTMCDERQKREIWKQFLQFLEEKEKSESPSPDLRGEWEMQNSQKRKRIAFIKSWNSQKRKRIAFIKSWKSREWDWKFISQDRERTLWVIFLFKNFWRSTLSSMSATDILEWSTSPPFHFLQRGRLDRSKMRILVQIPPCLVKIFSITHHQTGGICGLDWIDNTSVMEFTADYGLKTRQFTRRFWLRRRVLRFKVL